MEKLPNFGFNSTKAISHPLGVPSPPFFSSITRFQKDSLSIVNLYLHLQMEAFFKIDIFFILRSYFFLFFSQMSLDPKRNQFESIKVSSQEAWN